MKATMQIPDEMYREVKAKSALEGRSVRSVTVMLYASWLRGLVPDPESAPETSTKKPRGGKRPNLACFGVGRRFVRKNANGPHDMASIRESIAAGRKMSKLLNQSRRYWNLRTSPELILDLSIE